MTVSRSDNYLRKYRKRSGLTQTELGFLLGHRSPALVSRYEKQRVVPNLRTTLALSSSLGIVAEMLFAGAQRRCAAEVGRRMRELLAICEADQQRGNDKRVAKRKAAWLSERIRHIEKEHAA